MSGDFGLGVGSFDPTATGVLLWTHLEGGGPLRWEVARHDPAGPGAAGDGGFGAPVASGEAVADAGSGTVTVEVGGLEPGTSYRYRFLAGGRASPLGRTRTLPGRGAGRLRIGVACCARYSQQRFAVYRALADADLDLVVHLGDYIYEDAKGGLPDREPDPPGAVVTLDDYRRRHRQHRRDPDLAALHARHPMAVIWDDHDLADNAYAGGAAAHDPESQGPWEMRLAAALQAHHEFLPKRLADPADRRTAWRALRAGDLVELVCTETRAVRDAQAGLDGAAPADDPARSLLGDEQRAWLARRVLDPGPAWVLLASGVVVSELELPAPEALDGVLPEKYAVVDGRGVNTDQWDGYRAERDALAAALAERGGGAVILSGDIHSAWAIDGPVGPGGRPVAVELVCPPAATTPLGQLLPPGVGARLGPALVAALPRVRWVDVDHRGYLTLDVTRERCEATWWWVDPGADGPVRPVPARRWLVPRAAPGGLVDPEPGAARARATAGGDAGHGGPPVGAVRSRGWRRLAGAGVVVALLWPAVAGAVRRARRPSR